jgi:N-acetylneuraminic acid mutarotase
MIESLRNERMYSGVTVNEGKVYVIGGIDNNEEILNSIEKYDNKTGKWIQITVEDNGSNRRFNHSVVNVIL